MSLPFVVICTGVGQASHPRRELTRGSDNRGHGVRSYPAAGGGRRSVFRDGITVETGRLRLRNAGPTPSPRARWERVEHDNARWVKDQAAGHLLAMWCPTCDARAVWTEQQLADLLDAADTRPLVLDISCPLPEH